MSVAPGVGPGAGWVRMLSPLRSRDFRLLWTGMTLSLIGDGVLLVALAWQAYELWNHPAAMTLVGVALTGPQALCLLLGGIASDKFDRRRIMLAADAVRAACLALLALMTITGALALWQLVGLAAVYGAASGIFLPAFDGLVPTIVPEHRLTEANALNQVVRPVGLWLLGPALGGIIIGAAGAGWAFAFDALSFTASVVCLLCMSPTPAPAGAHVTLRSSVRELREGFAFVCRHPWLWASFTAATFTYLLFLGPTEVLLPYLVKNELGGDAHDLGIVLAAGGVGALAAALVIGQTGLPRRVITFTYTVWALATLAVAGYGMATSRWEAMAAAALVNGLEAVGTIAWTTIKQRHVPAELLGRVSAFGGFIAIALVPVSYALTAPAAEAVGARTALIGAGVLGALVTALFLCVSGVRDPERTGVVPSVVPVGVAGPPRPRAAASR
jgi:MFS family permease